MQDFRPVPYQQRWITDELLAWRVNPWFDDRRTPQVETRPELLQRSLTLAMSWLVEQYGDHPEQWTWGRLHPAVVGDAEYPLAELSLAVSDSPTEL